MRKYITLFFSVSVLLSACKGGGAPKGIISRDRMISLLTAFHMVDGQMYSVPPIADSLYKYGTDRYLILFKKFHTDSAQFRASLKYYTTQPVELQAMYDKILANLKQKTDSLNKIVEKNALRKE